MTNINCTKNCIFQKDGVCSYDNTTLILKSIDKTDDKSMVCAYQKKNKKTKA